MSAFLQACRSHPGPKGVTLARHNGAEPFTTPVKYKLKVKIPEEVKEQHKKVSIKPSATCFSLEEEAVLTCQEKDDVLRYVLKLDEICDVSDTSYIKWKISKKKFFLPSFLSSWISFQFIFEYTKLIDVKEPDVVGHETDIWYLDIPPRGGDIRHHTQVGFVKKVEDDLDALQFAVHQ
ncbi:hypothetical protein VKT23_002666 [Stygiomarasmius scandens]|uniref:Uncharacterized protein n=1 Tax=Marasmiellus scandens TaxID=2682957 RepID=A0ABR1K869_9AGAR